MMWLSRGLPLFLAVCSWTPYCTGSTQYQRQISDACDWLQSGAVAPRRQVRPVYLRCAQGRVEWKYPRGALRVVLRLGTSGRDFRGCLKQAGRRVRGARVYLEGHETLHPLYSADDKRNPELPRCFVSHRGQVALYVEADRSAYLGPSGVDLHYDLEAREVADTDPNSDCSPCDAKRLMSLFCSSDFAARGRMVALRHNQALQRTEVVVHVHALFRQTGTVFGDNRQTTCDVGGSGGPPLALGPRHGILYFPLHCQVERGSGEFMFLGRLRLGCPLVTCAPRWEEWRKARSGAAQRGLLPCRTPESEFVQETP